MERVHNFESLRGLLALFVVSIHIYLISGLTPDSLGIFHRLVMLHAPVDVFIILSGFVIFLLLDSRQEPFHLYIIRRAFRIFPAYLVCLAILIPILPLSLSVVESLPWRPDFVQGEIGALEASIQQFLPHLLSHLTLTNGLFGHWLPYSAFSFLGPAWSLSLEWQFYTVAPFIWACFKTKNRLTALLAVCVLTLAFWQFRHGEYMGFLPQKLPFFLVGILTFYVFKYRSAPLSKPFHWQSWAMLIVYTGWVACTLGFEAIIIWASVAFLSYRKMPVLEVPVLNYLGQISFSLYISHMLFVYIAMLLLQPFHIQTSWLYFTCLYSLSVPMVIGFSHVLYRQVEKPCMDYAKQLCKQMATSSATVSE